MHSKLVYFTYVTDTHKVYTAPHRVVSVIEPKFLLSLGLPLSHLLDAAQTLSSAELFLADIGLPAGLLSRVLYARQHGTTLTGGRDTGGAYYMSPFGDKFVVGLRRG